MQHRPPRHQLRQQQQAFVRTAGKWRQAHVQQSHAGLALRHLVLQQLERLAAIMRHQHRPALVLQGLRHPIREHRIVLDPEHRAAARHLRGWQYGGSLRLSHGPLTTLPR